MIRLDRRQVLVGERAVFWREIVIEAVVGGRPEGDLRAGEQRLHRFGEDVGIVVPRQFQRIGLVARGDQRERAIAGERPAEIDQLSIDAGGERRLGEAGADRRGDVSRSRSRRHFAHGTVGKADLEHV